MRLGDGCIGMLGNLNISSCHAAKRIACGLGERQSRQSTKPINETQTKSWVEKKCRCIEVKEDSSVCEELYAGC